MDLALVAVLIVVGIILLLAELFLLPGVSVAGVGGVISLVAAIVVAYTRMDPGAGRLVLFLTIVLMGLAIYVFLRFRTLDRMALHSNIDAKIDLVGHTGVQIGDVALTISRLAPMGKVTLNGNSFEAKTYGDLIDEGTQVKIVDIQGNTFVVIPNTDQEEKV